MWRRNGPSRNLRPQSGHSCLSPSLSDPPAIATTSLPCMMGLVAYIPGAELTEDDDDDAERPKET